MGKAELIPHSFKQKVRRIVLPAARFFLSLGMTPNTMTVLGVVLSIVSGVLYAFSMIFWGGIFYMLGGFCDMLDGAMARIQGRGSSFGAFLDSTLDRFAEAAALMGVMVHFHHGGETPMIYVTYLGITTSMMVSYTKARAEGLGQECNAGWMERPERMVLVIAGSLLLGDFGLKLAMVLMMTFAFVTVGQRMLHVWRGFKEKGKV